MPILDLHPRVAVSGISSFGWSLEEDLAFYRAEGIATVGIGMFKFPADRQAGIDAVKAADLRLSTLAASKVGSALVAPPRDGESEALQALRPAIDTAAALGSPSCYFTSGGTPPRMPTDEAFDALVAALAPVNAYAKRKGVRLAIENNSTTTRDNGFVHTLADAADLAREADIGICLDLQNCWLERRLDPLFRDNARHLVLVQVSDYLVGEPMRLNRRVPGDGSMPLEWLLGKLLDTGYGGLFELEVIGPKIDEEGYAPVIRRGVDWLSGRLRRWGV